MVDPCLQGNLYRHAEEPVAAFETKGRWLLKIDRSGMAAGESFVCY
jgi:hypothetical protein